MCTTKMQRKKGRKGKDVEKSLIHYPLNIPIAKEQENTFYPIIPLQSKSNDNGTNQSSDTDGLLVGGTGLGGWRETGGSAGSVSASASTTISWRSSGGGQGSRWLKTIAETLVASVESALSVRGAGGLEVTARRNEHGVGGIALSTAGALFAGRASGTEREGSRSGGDGWDWWGEVGSLGGGWGTSFSVGRLQATADTVVAGIESTLGVRSTFSVEVAASSD